MQDAFKAEADQTIERLKEELKKQNIDFAAIDRNDPQRSRMPITIQINIKGVPRAEVERFPQL